MLSSLGLLINNSFFRSFRCQAKFMLWSTCSFCGVTKLVVWASCSAFFLFYFVQRGWMFFVELVIVYSLSIETIFNESSARVAASMSLNLVSFKKRNIWNRCRFSSSIISPSSVLLHWFIEIKDITILHWASVSFLLVWLACHRFFIYV